jgi:hypothetical protein
MEWVITFLAEQKVVLSETQGVADEAGSLKMALDIFKTMQEHGALLCLVDHRSVHAVSSNITQVYYRPRALRRAGIPPNVKIAEVVLPAHEKHFAFFETVCFNNGLNLRTFKDRESALQWLTR